MKPRFVAEVSSNHGADLERSLDFVDTAARVGCDAVKFQQFRIEELFSPEALIHAPELLERKAWELPESFNRDLAERAKAKGLLFSSTPFYMTAVELLEPFVDFYKIASYQILWHDLLREVGRTGKPVLLATGMADLDEVRAAVAALRDAGAGELTLLHCVSSYPTPPEDANLRAIETMRDELGLDVGWSDHTVRPEVVRRAVGRFGASWVELHLDLDGNGDEYAGGHCWLPKDLALLIATIGSSARTGATEHVADGDGKKEPQPCELVERRWRTDPSDGLRPLLEERQVWRDDRAESA